MEGKKITKVLELGGSYVGLLLDDEEVAIVKVVTPDLPVGELAAFAGTEEPEAEAEPDKKKDKKESKKESKKEPDPEPEGEDYTWKDLEEMDYDALSKFCEDNDMGTDPVDFDEDEEAELRETVAKELEIEIPEKEAPETGDDDKGDDNPETADDDYTWPDLEKMDYDELKELCDENDTDTDPDDFEEDEEVDFRRAIAKEFGIEAPKKDKKKKKKK